MSRSGRRESIPVSVQRQIDEICLRFENEWQILNQQRIENFSFEIDERWQQDVIAELLMVEVDLRFHGDQPLDRSQYYRRFPDQRTFVDAAFGRIDRLGEFYFTDNDCIARIQVSDPLAAEDEPSDSIVLAFSGRQQIPKMISGYTVQECIGSGSFGVVFRAWDQVNDRMVALKFPRCGMFATGSEMQQFLSEANEAKRLNHHGIVKTFHIGHDQGYVFIVQELIEGDDLQSFDRSDWNHQNVASLIANVADAMSEAHRNGLYHRDLKPSNILISPEGDPKVIDFGLAIHESAQQRRRGERVGAPAYMSPELVRGETHLIDGRSDVWSIGVIFYELLIERRPFKGIDTELSITDSQGHQDRLATLFSEIKYREPPPLRQFAPDVPKELERICLRCLEKKISDRYLTTGDLANDLRRWLANPDDGVATHQTVKIEPQGLRPFGPEQAESFCRLLPGPRDRSGLPLSVRFWKNRIESSSPEVTFSVGFVYGPSGSGKSSFIRAGVLPNLSEHVIPIYIEATAHDTEVRLIKSLRRHFPDLPEDLPLPTIFDGMREGQWIPTGKKLVLVFDQFEQWLHKCVPSVYDQLIQALRHCDGKHVQAICMVRDDFWLATTRFKDALEVALVDGHNAMLIDRFDVDHAQKVLSEFGRAYGYLPENQADITREQKHFLNRAVADLAEDSRVISVRLALFAEMFKDCEWTLLQLKRVGGIAGVGEAFLHEAFSSRNAPRKYRRHDQAARAVLERLLPGTRKLDIKIRGVMCTGEELLHVSTYEDKPNEFNQLIEILDKELRLITPASPDITDLSYHQEGRQHHYQLTHDYLVPVIRNWLTRRKKETWAGRAELKLNELSTQWNGQRQDRYLPSLVDYLRMRFGLSRRRMSVEEKDLLTAAKRFHLFRAIAFIGIACVVFTTLWQVSNLNFQSRAEAQLSKFLDCAPEAASDNLANLSTFRSVYPKVRDQLSDVQKPARVSLANNDLVSPTAADTAVIVDALTNVNEREYRYLLSELLSYKELAKGQLMKRTERKPDLLKSTRIFVALICCGETSEAQEVFSNAEDRSLATFVSQNLATLMPDQNQLLDLANDNRSDPDMLFGFLSAASNASFSSLSRETQDGFCKLICDEFENNPDSGVHGVCQHLAKLWDVELPEILPTDLPGEDFQWWCVKVSKDVTMTFVYVPTGRFIRGKNGARNQNVNEYAPQVEVTIDQPFWIAQTETPFSVFENWLDKENPVANDLAASLSLDSGTIKQRMKQDRTKRFFEDRSLPVFGMSFKEAETWVAWLDRVHPDHYLSIPICDEWEWACRQDTTTFFHFGSLKCRKYLGKFAVQDISYETNPDHTSRIEQPFSRLPTRLGLSDMTGNLAEYNRRSAQEEKVDDKDNCFHMGGALSNPIECSSGYRQRKPDNNSFDYFGLRLVLRTGKASPKD